MPSNDRLTEFIAVVDAGSISGAARSLGLPRATLSRRISDLEAELGVCLLHRSTRRLVLSRAGKELERHARRIVQDAAEAWSAVQRLDDVPRGLLRVSDIGEWMNPFFVRFLLEFPEVQLEVRSTTRHVDLVAEGVDVALRLGAIRDPELIVRKILPAKRVVVGSPSYLEERGTPTEPRELSAHDCIVWFTESLGPAREWPLLFGDGMVAVHGRLSCNNVGLMRDAAVNGLGLAMLPRVNVLRELAAGTLVEVLNDSVGADASANLVYTDRRYIEPKVRAFVDGAVPYLEALLMATFRPS